MNAAARMRRVEALVENLRAALPEPVREASADVAVSLEPRVAPHWLADGVEPDSLGLFSGPSMRDSDADGGDEAPLVTLFVENLWDYADGDEAVFDEEVRRTLLHELGHFLGLEEDDMVPRDLD